MNRRTSKQESTKNQCKEMKGQQQGEEVPFGPPPEEYKYRCSQCKYEMWVNEAIIDFVVKKYPNYTDIEAIKDYGNVIDKLTNH